MGKRLPAAGDHFAWLAGFLSPFKDEAALSSYSAAVTGNWVQWGPVLYQANVHFCTPLWFTSLQRDGLLELIPEELREYLVLMHQANAERNETFRHALRAILMEFERHGIRNVLLKGAATFQDRLYPDAGDRMMGDLDILIEPQAAAAARRALRDLGFREEKRVAARSSDNRFTGNERHHLPRANLPGTPVDVELHTRVADRQCGRVIPVESAWRHARPVRFEGIDTSILEPTYRLIHNAMHALVPHQEFIGSNVSLRQLVEFAYLAERYGADVCWEQWLAEGAKENLGLEFSCYLQLAHRVLGMPVAPTVALSRRASLHVRRIMLAARHAPTAERPSSLIERVRQNAVRLILGGYRRMKRPVWLWRNTFYSRGVCNLPRRMGMVALGSFGSKRR